MFVIRSPAAVMLMMYHYLRRAIKSYEDPVIRNEPCIRFLEAPTNRNRTII